MNRRPAVAGMFYEADPEALCAQLEGCFLGPLGPGALPEVNASGPRSVVGLVVPHAGVMYSGYAAAHAYRHLAEDGPVDVAVILCPNHHGVGHDNALWPAGQWLTPLGTVPIAEDVCAALLARCPLLRADPVAHVQEHGIEVQLPFLQMLYGDRISLVPIAMKRYSLEGCTALGEAVGAALAGRNAVVIASSDFSHYESAAVAREQDAYALGAIEALDPGELFRRVRERSISTCGFGPVAAMLAAMRSLGARRAEVLAYTTSGDVTGDQDRVVGYAALKVSR